MAVRLAAGAEYGAVVEAGVTKGGNVNTSTTQKASGSYAYDLDNSQGNYLSCVPPAGGPFTEAYIQFRFWVTGSLNNPDAYLIKWFSGSTIIGCITMSAASLFQVYVGDKATLVGTSTNPMPSATWVLIELHLKIDGSAGIIDFRLQGSDEVSFSGKTNVGSETNFSSFRIFGGIDTYPGHKSYTDDIILNDTTGSVNNSWVNALRIVTLRPTGAGNYAQWTPSAGVNWQCVDEIPPSITDYNYTNATGNKDSFVMSDLPAAAVSVAAVIPQYFCSKEGVPTVGSLKRLLRISSTDYQGSPIAIPASFGIIQEILETSPATTNAFTVSEVNGMEVGYNGDT